MSREVTYDSDVDSVAAVVTTYLESLGMSGKVG